MPEIAPPLLDPTRPPACAECDDAGYLVRLDSRGERVAYPCACRVEGRRNRLWQQSRIPSRYQRCTFDNFDYARTNSIGHAFSMAHKFALAFPAETEGKGLLLIGSPGLGKTHLAISVLRHAILERSAIGYFWEHKQLLEKLRSTYDGNASEPEYVLLRRIETCELLVLDDLGEITPSDWAWDTTAHILNSRYNADRSTIVTTNRPNRPALSRRPGEESSQLASARLAFRTETLGDRIGDRMLSRLQEMCVPVPLEGADYRLGEKRASFT